MAKAEESESRRSFQRERAVTRNRIWKWWNLLPADPKKIAPSREKKKHIGGYFDEAVYRQMKHIGIEKNMTTQDILAAALNAWFQMHDKPPIA